jgi:hypothetical protein
VFYPRPFRQLAGEGDFFNSTQMRSKQFLIPHTAKNTGGETGTENTRTDGTQLIFYVSISLSVMTASSSICVMTICSFGNTWQIG